MDLSTTLLAIRSLPINDRIRLVQTIWDEIATDQAFPPLSDAQQQELERRLAEDDADSEELIPWEVIKAEAHARSKR